MDANPDISLLVEKLTPYQISQALDISIADATALIEGTKSVEDFDESTQSLLLELNDKLTS